jgi:hypothetical protein
MEGIRSVGSAKICILALSPLARDARVLRQVELLAPHHQVTVVGFEPFPTHLPGVRWLKVEAASGRAERMAGVGLLALGRLLPGAHELWFRLRSLYQGLRETLGQECFDLVYANDWNTLPLAAEVARRCNARLVFDAHEFSPLEWEQRWWWRQLYAPLIRRVLRRYGPLCDASVTVSAPIAERYRREYGLDAVVVLNAPAAVRQGPAEQAPPPSPDRVRLIHHGAAIRARHLERMIEAIALAQPRFTLDMMLVGDGSYISELQALAESSAPGRVRFVPPADPADIVARVAAYDMGFYLLESTLFNHAMALPNKIFDYVSAGLPVCIGPSPAMAALAQEHGFGCIAPSFAPEAVAATLDALTPAELLRLREGARRASAVVNAETEMRKLMTLLEPLLPAARPARALAGVPGPEWNAPTG